MNNKTLVLILGALIGIYLLSQFLSAPKDRSFDPNLLQIDTSKVTKIEVDLLEGEDFYLEKSGSSWKGYKGDLTVEAMPNAIAGMLTHMAGVKILRISTKDKAKWPNFEIEEGKAKARITFSSGSKKLKTIIIGGFRFNQEARSAQSFMRLPEGDEVYAVDGFASMSLGQGFDTFRDRTVLGIDQEAIAGIEIKTPETTFSMQKTIGGWMDDAGTPLDSAKVTNYLRTLSNFRASGFNDNYRNNADFQHSISIQSSAQAIPFQLHLNKVENETLPFALMSTARPNITFAGDSTNTFNKLIVSRADLLP